MAGLKPEERTKLKILIVDDVELNRALLCEMFQAHYEVCEAENGQEAVELLEREADSISIVLLDIVMPVLDGFGVLREMIARGWIGRIPVVMITAETSDSVMQKGYEMGAADIISKPFNPNIVRQRIRNIIEQYTYRGHLEKIVEDQMETLRKQAQKLRENTAQMIDTLSAIIEFKNTESVSHIRNIRTITRLLLTELSRQHGEYGLTEDLIEVISQSAAMHDIGKIAIPDQILNKPGRLTPEEFEIMKTHAVRGCEILQKLSQVQSLDYYDYCYEICRHHHERWDGRGYPDGLKGDETPIWAQVVSLADVYDALTSKRVYKEAYENDTAVRMILNGECGVFNPILIDCFKRIVPELKEYSTRGDREEEAPLPLGAPHAVGQAEPQGQGDVSARTLRLLEMERQKYRILSDLSDEIVFEYDVKTDTLTFSEKYQILTGRDMVVRDLTRRVPEDGSMLPEDWDKLLEKLAHITPAHPSCKMEMRLNLVGGKLEWYEVYVYPVWDVEYEAACAGYIGKFINIEARKSKNLQLQKAADSDPLTDVYNRKAIREQVSAILSSGQTKHAALCFIDIDNFKAVNDGFGHIFGDSILKRVAAMLRSCTRQTDLVGRIGGDEFVVFFRDIADNNIEAKAATLCESLRRNFDGCNISGSVGISRYPRDGEDYDTLLCRADQALYLSKRMGKDAYQFYNAECAEMPFRSLLSGVDVYDEKIESMAQTLKSEQAVSRPV